MNIYEKQFDLAKQLHTSGRVKEAQKIYIKLLKIKKKINIQVEKNYLFNSKKFTLDLEDIYYKLSLKI